KISLEARLVRGTQAVGDNCVAYQSADHLVGRITEDARRRSVELNDTAGLVHGDDGIVCSIHDRSRPRLALPEIGHGLLELCYLAHGADNPDRLAVGVDDEATGDDPAARGTVVGPEAAFETKLI